MGELSAELNRECRAAFLQCHEFDSDAELKVVFVTSELRPFQSGLPQTISKEARSSQVLAYLVEKQLSDGRSVLPIFLQELAHRRDPMDIQHNILKELAKSIQTTSKTEFESRNGDHRDLPPFWRTMFAKMRRNPYFILGSVVIIVVAFFFILWLSRLADQGGLEPTAMLQPTESPTQLLAAVDTTTQTPTPSPTDSPTKAPTPTYSPIPSTPTMLPSVVTATPTLIMTPTPTSNTVVPVAEVNPTYSSVYLRQGPGQCFNDNGYLERGDTVNLIARNDTGDIWFFVSVPGDGREGWVDADVLDFELTPEALPTAVNIPTKPPTCTLTLTPSATSTLGIPDTPTPDPISAPERTRTPIPTDTQTPIEDTPGPPDTPAP